MENVQQWLKDIGLETYEVNFQVNRIRSVREMEILKTFDRKDIEKELGITKEGHIKRLMYAISMLKEPTEGQLKIMRMRQVIEGSTITDLSNANVEEYDFWEKLKAKCLEPDLKAFGIDAEIKVKLIELRNSWLMVMGVSNILWLILMTTLAANGELTIVGANALGLIFLFMYSFIFIIQFVCMIVHRLWTTCHYLARAPYSFNKPLYTQWSFTNNMSPKDPVETENVRQVKEEAPSRRSRPRRKAKQINSKRSNSLANEETFLIMLDRH